MFQPVPQQFLRRSSSLKIKCGPRSETRQIKSEDNEDGEEEEEVQPCLNHSVVKAVEMRNGNIHIQENNYENRTDRIQKDRNIVFDPDGNVAYYWMGVVSLAVIYNLAVIILRLTFNEMRELWLPLNIFYVLDLISDALYILDIAFQFRITYYDDGCLEMDPAKLAFNYRRQNRFKLDIAAVFPLHSVSSTILGFMSIVTIPAFPRGNLYIPLTRLPRLLKIHNMARFFDITDSRTSNPNKVRAFKLSLYLWLVIHWIGCVYYIISEHEGRGSNEWVYPKGEDFDPFTRKYIRSLYWSMLILTTIGERPSPNTDLEYVFTGMTFVIGVFVFAAVVGNVGDVISNMNASRQDFQARMDQIKFYMNHQKVPENLQNRVKRWAEYSWSRTKAMEVSHLLQMLPHRLRSEIAIQVHLDTLKKVKIFEECEEGLLRELVLKLKPQIFSPGDYICHIGEIGREMYIINHGKVEILVPNAETGHRTVVKRLVTGHYFGEISLLKLDEGQNRRTADVRAVGYSELLCLSRKDLMAALVEYPEAKQILEKIARERINETNTVIHTNENEGIQAAKEKKPNLNNVKKRKDWFIDVIKSDGFQKLMSNRGTEISELQKVMDELKKMKSEFHHALSNTEKLRSLERKLSNRENELQNAQHKIAQLEENLRLMQCNSDSSRKWQQNEQCIYSPTNTNFKYSHSNGTLTNTPTSCERICQPRRSIGTPKFKYSERSLKNCKKCSSESCLHSDVNHKNKHPIYEMNHSVQKLSRNSRTSSKCVTDVNTSSKGRITDCLNSKIEPSKVSKRTVPFHRSASDTRHSESIDIARNSSGYSSDTETMATLLRAKALLGSHDNNAILQLGDNSVFETDESSSNESNYVGDSDTDESKWKQVTDTMLKLSSALMSSSSQQIDNSNSPQQNIQSAHNTMVKETVV